uniref:Connector enhancer of kinase suppressor of Ras 1 n=1 Tax=Apteryx owenii TaxID=8824 RepID=A0A8B9PVK9_APTOW
MEPVGAWSPAQAAAWLRGLDAAVQGYPFEAWGLPGAAVLRLSAGALEALGVRRVGHQELLLEAVEQLRALVSPLASTSLRTLTEKLRELACRAQALALGERSAGATPRPPSLDLLACVVDLVGAAKGLFSWLNRYLFSTLNDYSASRDIVFLCAELVEALQEVSAADSLPAHRGHLREHRGLQPRGAAGPHGRAAARGAGAGSARRHAGECPGAPGPQLPPAPRSRLPSPSPSAGPGHHIHQLRPALHIGDRLGGELGAAPGPACHLPPPRATPSPCNAEWECNGEYCLSWL